MPEVKSVWNPFSESAASDGGSGVDWWGQLASVATHGPLTMNILNLDGDDPTSGSYVKTQLRPETVERKPTQVDIELASDTLSSFGGTFDNSIKDWKEEPLDGILNKTGKLQLRGRIMGKRYRIFSRLGNSEGGNKVIYCLKDSEGKSWADSFCPPQTSTLLTLWT